MRSRQPVGSRVCLFRSLVKVLSPCVPSLYSRLLCSSCTHVYFSRYALSQICTLFIKMFSGIQWCSPLPKKIFSFASARWLGLEWCRISLIQYLNLKYAGPPTWNRLQVAVCLNLSELISFHFTHVSVSQLLGSQSLAWNGLPRPQLMVSHELHLLSLRLLEADQGPSAVQACPLDWPTPRI